MTELFRHYLHYSLHSLTKYDYMALGWVLFLALLLMILAAFVKRRGASYLLLFLGLLLFFFGPVAIKLSMDRLVRAAEVNVATLKPLRYSDSLLIEGSVENRGKIDFSSCDMVVLLYRPSTPLKEWAAYIKPFRVAVVPVQTPLQRKETKPFRILVDDFGKKGDFNATIVARCYP